MHISIPTYRASILTRRSNFSENRVVQTEETKKETDVAISGGKIERRNIRVVSDIVCVLADAFYPIFIYAL